MRDMLNKARERGLDILHEARAAGTGQEAFFSQFLGFGLGHDIGAQSGLDDGVEAQLLQAGDDLTELCVGELAGDSGSNYRVYSVIALGLVRLAVSEDLYRVDDEGFVKYIEYGAGWIELRSANPAYSTMRYEGTETERVRVVGLVTGSTRRNTPGIKHIGSGHSSGLEPVLRLTDQMTAEERAQLAAYAQFIIDRRGQ